MARNNGLSPLASAIVTAVTPLINKMNEGQEFAEQAGHTPNHQNPRQNGYFKMIVGQLAQQNWRLLYDGTMKRADGTPTDTILSMIAKRSQDVQDLVNRKYAGDWAEADGDPTVVNAALYIGRLTTQAEVVQDLLDQITEAYAEIFDEKWEPLVNTGTTNQPKPEAKKAAVANLAAKFAAAGANVPKIADVA